MACDEVVDKRLLSVDESGQSRIPHFVRRKSATRFRRPNARSNASGSALRTRLTCSNRFFVEIEVGFGFHNLQYRLEINVPTLRLNHERFADDDRLRRLCPNAERGATEDGERQHAINHAAAPVGDRCT
jgi:hypothetical protein